jgi:hypothetical protein
MRFRVRYSDTFDASFQRSVPAAIQPQIRHFIEARLSRRPRDGSMLWPPSHKELRTDAIYAGTQAGHLRILFEIAGDEVIVWSVSKGRLPNV